MKEFFKETTRDEYLEYFSVNKRKFKRQRITTAFLYAILALAVLLVTEEKLFIILVPILGFLGYKMPFIKLLAKKEQDALVREYSFPNFLSFFIVLISSHGNVYSALKATEEHINSPLKEALQKLIAGLETSHDRRELYMEFASFVGKGKATQAMDVIYQCDVDGINKDALRSLEELNDRLRANVQAIKLEKESKSIEKYGTPAIVIAFAFVMTFVFTMLLQITTTL